ncbi:MAG: sugar ABC transporter permease [Spirochaetales bacterium]|nr:MAG: sugar ABC transporter permease [Spirochaetales bacterium]
MKSELNKKTKIAVFDVRTYMMVFALLAIWIIFTAFSRGTFLTPRNMSNMFRQSVFTAILALGMVLVIILGQIDLSVGSMAGLCGGILAMMNVWNSMPPGVAIALTILTGLALGLWNGFWIAYRNVPSFIVTMAGLLIFRGILTGITDGITIGPVSPFFGLIGKEFLPKNVGIIIGIVTIGAFLFFQYRGRMSKAKYNITLIPIQREILKSFVIIVIVFVFVFMMNAYHGVPNPVIILLLFFVIFNYLSTRTVFGRRIYAIGGNNLASKLAGINIKRITLIVFVINGLMAALAGIFLTSRLSSASINAGTSAELDAIAACVIGGTSLMGGIGTVPGAIIGAVVMASLDNGMSLLDAPFFWQTIVKGLVLIAAVWFDMSKKQRAL